MRVLNIPDTIRYQITPHRNGVMFCLWETTEASGSCEPAFLFKVKQRVSSKEEAQQLLRTYLEHLE